MEVPPLSSVGTGARAERTALSKWVTESSDSLLSFFLSHEMEQLRTLQSALSVPALTGVRPPPAHFPLLGIGDSFSPAGNVCKEVIRGGGNGKVGLLTDSGCLSLFLELEIWRQSQDAEQRAVRFRKLLFKGAPSWKACPNLAH